MNLAQFGLPRNSQLNFRALGAIALSLLLLELGIVFGGVTPALGASVTSASFSGGAGTVVQGGKLYAKQGGALTLNMTTDADTRCVELSGAVTATLKSATATTSWSRSVTAPAGNGVQTVTATAFKRPHSSQDRCIAEGGEALGAQTASYILDNTGPAVSATLDPNANAAGWNKDNVKLTWSALDDAGVASGPTPATDGQTSNTAGVTKSATATDRLGNTATGQVVVRLDKDAPTINATRSPAPNSFGWNNTDVTVAFTCADVGPSGIASCTGGDAAKVTTEGTNQTLPGTATDHAGNSNSAGVSGINIDKTAPQIAGAPTTAPNADGWYAGDVTIAWATSDDRSGINPATDPADTVLKGEGKGLTASASVADKAGNPKSATSAPVNIDRTKPLTTATAPTGWNNVDVDVVLAASDNGSGVKATHYAIDGGAVQTGTKVPFASEGTHTLEYWSTDVAGNVEAKKSVQVKIDKTKPSITHTLAPLANDAGWNRTDVKVTFECADNGGSQIASCTSPQDVTTEGKDQLVEGTATDGAGNTATDPARVSLDKTDPTISAAADRDPNAAGWYNADVTVSFTAADELSGIVSKSAAKTLGEGENQSATGTAKDAAGNEKSASLNDVDVDKTPPTLTGSPSETGWAKGNVTVTWTCADTLSGLAGSCPQPTVVEGEGDALSASAQIADKAGNTAAKTVGGIKIDRTAPTTRADVAEPLPSGWYAGDVEVTLEADDKLSGVDKTYYSLNGGAAQEYAGAFEVTGKGRNTVRFWSTDKAGNVEDREAAGHTLAIDIDGIAPKIAGSRTPAANAHGWNNSDVVVSFACEDAESGVAGCTDATTLSNEGADQEVVGKAIDVAGNEASAKVDGISIDKTRPTLSGAPTAKANGAGWYKDDVTIAWTGADGLSGIDPATQPANSTITGEGDNLGAGPKTITDRAGNPSAEASVSGIKIDRTPPQISGAPTTAPNAAGWYSGNVTVDFKCTDTLSGVALCPTSKLVSGNGANQSVTSDPAEDAAGNVAAGKTVGGINIDGMAPTTTADNQCTKTNGWCTGSTATVVLTAADQAGLSGVKEIRYSVNGGAEQVAAAATKSVSVPLDGSGEANVAYYAIDRAGNAEPKNGVALKYDNIAPTVTHAVSPTPNAGDWNKDDVTVSFSAKDNDAGSGVDAATVTPDVKVTEDTAGQVVNGSAKDLAGNLGTDSVTVKLDKTAPSISAKVVDGTQGQDGWYTGPVKVEFTCSDDLSTIATCPDPVTLTDNGSNNEATGTATDKAGNTKSVKLDGIKIDREKPAITLSGIKSGGVYTLGEEPKAGCTATDGFSGAGACTLQVAGGKANGVGTFTYTATATDKAGNVSTLTGSYRVVYRWDGFRQPITDTAHQTGPVSMFKAGSTVPVKYQLKKADGTVVKPNEPGSWLTPKRGGMTIASASEELTAAADSGLDFRYDADGQQSIYNWGTPKDGGYYFRVGVTLDDGQTYTVAIGLR